MRRDPLGRPLAAVAAIAIASFLAHGANHVRRGDPLDMLWMCNVAPILLAVGALARSAGWVTVAAEWLSFGVPVWLIDVVSGGELIPTSIGPHLACPVAAIYALELLGVRRRSFIVATVLVLGLVGLSRLVTPPESNVNVAFTVWKPWQPVFPSYGPYFAFMLASMAVTFFVFETAIARLFPAPPP